MFTNADVTLYSCAKDGKFTRSVIKKVFWDEVKQSNIIKSGLTTADSVKIFIPSSSVPDGLNLAAGKDLMVKGIIDFIFNNTSPQTISESLTTLKVINKVVTVSVVDDKTYGSPSMQHYEISCK
jgi:hypothetical protein